MGLLGAAGGGAGWHAWRTVYKDYERSPLPALTERANESVEFVHRSDKDFYAIVAALLTAAATVATVFCIYTGDFFAWRLYAAVSLVWAGTFGLLSYFVLSAWKNLIGKWWLGPIGGFLIGAIPTMLLMVVTGSGDLEATFLAGLLGLCGGTTAWFMWRYVHHLLRLK
ncbi:MAG: hypothetical protein KKA05_08650 [Alphaproteobacteria bacterium]|nr:hypothetical protein [Alphaproteobacteria bacterium]